MPCRITGRTHPNSHFGSDAEDTLGEETVVVRTEAVVEQLPRHVRRLLIRPYSLDGPLGEIGHSAHSGLHELAAGQDHLHSAVHHEVVLRMGYVSIRIEKLR